MKGHNMKYLVDIKAIIQITDVEIDVSEFNKEKMAKVALEKWFESLRGEAGTTAIDDVGILENWNIQD